MRVSVHLKPFKTNTNQRSRALGELLQKMGHDVTWTTRDFVVEDTQLTIQTCFAPSVAIHDAIARKIPYLIMEAPYFRAFYSSADAGAWGYNGLSGGSWRPEAGEEERPHPELAPMKEEGRTLIVGQKPTDLSLRGADHVQWILDRFEEFPDADFRPHPHMVWPRAVHGPIADKLKGYSRVITYNSTSVVDAIIAGCEVRVDGPCSLAPKEGVTREEWIHDLSWAQANYHEYDQIVDNILGGYEEARDRMQSGQHELAQVPRNGKIIRERYYRTIDHSQWGGADHNLKDGPGAPRNTWPSDHDKRGVPEDSD